MTDACAQCQAPLLPHLAVCLACDIAKGASLPPGAPRRYRVIGPVQDSAKLATAFARLAPSMSVSDVDWVLRQSTFDVTGEFRTREETRLRAILNVCGARYFVESGNEAPTSRRWSVDRRAAAKVGTVVAIGAAAVVWTVPIVPIVAVAMLALFAARATSKVACEIVIARARAAELLDVVPSSALDEARIAARATGQDTRDSFRAGFAALLDVAAFARKDAGHLTREELGKLDATVARLVRPFARLAATATTSRALTATASEIASIRDALVASGDASVAEDALGQLAGETTRALESLDAEREARRLSARPLSA